MTPGGQPTWGEGRAWAQATSQESSLLVLGPRQGRGQTCLLQWQEQTAGATGLSPRHPPTPTS